MITCPVHKTHYKHLGLIDYQSRRLSKDKKLLTDTREWTQTSHRIRNNISQKYKSTEIITWKMLFLNVHQPLNLR